MSHSQQTRASAKDAFQNKTARRTALAVLGGISVASLMYKAYKALPAPHPSIPTAPGMHPLLGHVPLLTKDLSQIHDVQFELIKDFEIVAIQLPEYHRIYINSPRLCEWVFTKEFDKFYKGSSNMLRLEELFGPYGAAILGSDDEQWKFHRKIGSRMFSVFALMFTVRNTMTSTDRSGT